MVVYELEQFAHAELMAFSLNVITELVKDPLLRDLHSEPTVEEVNSQIALEHGQAITVNIRQQNEGNTILRKALGYSIASKRAFRSAMCTLWVKITFVHAFSRRCSPGS